MVCAGRWSPRERSRSTSGTSTTNARADSETARSSTIFLDRCASPPAGSNVADLPLRAIRLDHLREGFHGIEDCMLGVRPSCAWMRRPRGSKAWRGGRRCCRWRRGSASPRRVVARRRGHEHRGARSLLPGRGRSDRGGWRSSLPRPSSAKNAIARTSTPSSRRIAAKIRAPFASRRAVWSGAVHSRVGARRTLRSLRWMLVRS